MYTRRTSITAAIVATAALAGALSAGLVEARSGLEPTALAPLPGFDESGAYSMNDRGDAVGESIDDVGFIATRWDRRSGPTPLAPLPDHDASRAEGMNNRGDAVGLSVDTATGRETATLWTQADLRVALDPLDGFENSQATDVNDAGVIVGVSQNGPSFFPIDGTPTRWNRAGEATALELPEDYDFGKPGDVNRRGESVGSVFGPFVPPSAALWDRDGSLTLLDPPPGYEVGQAIGINDHGEVVGAAFGPDGGDAVVWDRDGNPTVLPDPVGADVTIAVDINNRGEIIGESASFPPEPGPPVEQLAIIWDTAGNASLLTLPPGAEGALTFEVSSGGAVVGRSFGPEGATAVVWN